MKLEKRLTKLEAVVRRHQEAPDPVDLSRLSEAELQDLEALNLKAGDTWDLSRLTADDLRTLRVLLQKAYQMEDTAL